MNWDQAEQDRGGTRGRTKDWIRDGVDYVDRVGDGRDSEEEGRILVDRLDEPADWFTLRD